MIEFEVILIVMTYIMN